MQRPLKIGFLSPHNPFDRRAFSGTAFYMYRALGSRADVQAHVLGPHRRLTRLDRIRHRLIRPSRFELDATKLDLPELDWIIALMAHPEVAKLHNRPVSIAVVTDATPGFLREFYGAKISVEAEGEEADIMHNSALTLYSSKYMVDRAVVELRADAARTRAIPFGANLDALPETIPRKPPLSPLNLLWVGSGWTRKGGDIALAAFEALRASGVEARLRLAGDVPAKITLPAGAERAGYLDKNRPQHAARLSALYARSHLFILPTRADCTPMVLAEANAHGTPVLVTETGGIGSLVEEGKSGRMLPMTAGPDEWAAAIRNMTADPEAHAALCRSSFEHAHTRLSWDAWARDVTALLRERVA